MTILHTFRAGRSLMADNRWLAEKLQFIGATPEFAHRVANRAEHIPFDDACAAIVEAIGPFPPAAVERWFTEALGKRGIQL